MENLNMVSDNSAIKLDLFGRVLQDRITKLAGGNILPRQLEIDVPALVCIALIAERCEELKKGASANPFDKEKLVHEALELGLPRQLSIESALQTLLNQGYIQVLEGKIIEPKAPIFEAMGILQKLFPRMAGMNMLAYLVQTIEEVFSGRKDLDSAVRQFDDTLRIHGKPIRKKRTRKTPGPSFPIKGLKEAAKVHSSQTISGAPNIISSAKGSSEVEIKNFEMTDLFAETDPSIHDQTKDKKLSCAQFQDETVPEISTEDIGSVQDKTPEDDQPIGEGNSVEMLEAMGEDEPLAPAIDETQKEENKALEFAETKGIEGDLTLPLRRGPRQEKSGPAHQTRGPNDEEVEKKIYAFEEDLALLCPLCEKGKVERHTTSKGKTYYQCTLDSCNFISWGKPIHTRCPVCNNPFLVEATSSSEDTFLKCPRATCGYKGPINYSRPLQPAPKLVKRPRRRVAKRRVVRCRR